jgi:hypothetical protein
MNTKLVLRFAAVSIAIAATTHAATPFYSEVFANMGEGDAGRSSNGRLVQAADGIFTALRNRVEPNSVEMFSD